MRWDWEAVKTRVKMAKAVARASSKVMRMGWRGARAICARASIGAALRLRVVNHIPNCKICGKNRRKTSRAASNKKTAIDQVESALVGRRQQPLREHAYQKDGQQRSGDKRDDTQAGTLCQQRVKNLAAAGAAAA